MTAPTLRVPDPVERDDLAVFAARAVRLDAEVAVRLRRAPTAAAGNAPTAAGSRVEAWAQTPFDALATRAVRGGVEPDDVTVPGPDLLAALSMVGGDAVEAGARVDERWRGPLPTAGEWTVLDEIPGDELDGLAERGIAAAREGEPSGRPSAGLLDQVVLTVSGDRDEVRVPMRCVFALSGMGFLGAGEAGPVRVSSGGGWLRMDAHGGAVVRRRRPQLPLA